MQDKDGIKTAIYVGVAGLMVAFAYLSQPTISRDNAAFDDSREPFYEAVKPDAAKALEVIVFNEKLGSMKPFRVQFKNNRWTIPSHNDYPADAEDRLKKSAGAILGLKKDSIVTDLKDLHAELGVVDPLSDDKSSKGWGTRIKLFSEGDKILADFIVGKDVPNKTGFKYMRVPGKDRVYAVEAKDLELSVNFADWIDTNLLETSSFDIEKVTLKDYSVDRARGAIDDRGSVTMVKDPQATDWKVEGLGPKEETDKDKTRDLATALADVRIVGVREKPKALSADLQLANEMDVEQMIARGFYPVRVGQTRTLVSDQGETIFETKDGLQYTLRFGGFIVASSEELTKGKKDEKAKKDETPKDAKTKDEKSKDDKKADDKTKDGEAQECRFLLVTVGFNESKYPPIPDPPAIAAPAAAKPGDAKAAEEAKKKAEEDKKNKADEVKRQREERQKKIDDGKKKAKELTDRYALWYYVIPNDTFKKVRLTRKDLVKEKKDEAKPGAEGAGAPTLPSTNPITPMPPKTEQKPTVPAKVAPKSAPAAKKAEAPKAPAAKKS